MKIYNVREGDSLISVAESFGVSPIKLAANNGLMQKSRLIVGEELLIITPTRVANVKRGETLADIAARFCTTEKRLLALNPELEGRRGVYEGQPLCVRGGDGLFGIGIGNGYFYRGCSMDRLRLAMPYMSYITVCTGIVRGGVGMLFDDRELIDIARAEGKIPLFRLFVGEVQDERSFTEIIKGLAILAGGRGYSGVVLAGINAKFKLAPLIVEARKILMECDLKLYIEGDILTLGDEVGYADGAVLHYDKLGEELIPSLDEGEVKAYTDYAEKYDSLRSFIDLSPFAYIGGKYVTISEARDQIAKGRGEIRESVECGYILGEVGKGRRARLYMYRSMKATERILRAVSELGYYGVSFDIARCPVYDLVMLVDLFSESKLKF